MAKIVRRLRLLEYVGSEEFIADAINKAGVKGCVSTARGSIRSAWLGETNEILTEAEVTDVEAQRKARGIE